MKIKASAGERGFLRLIILIIILILVVSYFGVSIRQVVQSPTTQDNVSYVWTGVVNVWDDYLQVPATAVWNFFVTYVWTPGITAIEQKALQAPSLTSSSTPTL